MTTKRNSQATTYLNKLNVTAQNFGAVLQMVEAVRIAIRDLGRVPSGELYAHLCGKLTLDAYQSIITLLVDAKQITVENHEIVYVGRT